MDEEIQAVAQYLTKELMKSSVLDAQVMEAKIKAALVILSTDKEKGKPFSKFKSKVSSQALVLHRKEVELNYWKNELRFLVREDGMKPRYEEIDKKLTEMGLKKVEYYSSPSKQ